MSYILDALKKAEHEKLKKSVTGMSTITGDLFQERSQPEPSSGRWKLVALISLVVIITSAGTWLALRGKKTGKATAVSEVVVQPLAVGGANSPAISQHAPPPVIKPSALTAVPTPPVQVSAPETVADNRRPTSVKAKKASRQVKSVTPAPAAKPVLQSIQPPADIKVSGIAWQEERSARRAVINGFLIKEGGVVSGSKISEILSDRVRFVSPVGKYEIRLDNAPVAEGRR